MPSVFSHVEPVLPIFRYIFRYFAFWKHLTLSSLSIQPFSLENVLSSPGTDEKESGDRIIIFIVIIIVRNIDKGLFVR